MTSQIFLTLTINKKPIKKYQSSKIDATIFIIKQSIRICYFLKKYLTFIDIISQSSILKTVSESKYAYILDKGIINLAKYKKLLLRKKSNHLWHETWASNYMKHEQLIKLLVNYFFLPCKYLAFTP